MHSNSSVLGYESNSVAVTSSPSSSMSDRSMTSLRSIIPEQDTKTKIWNATTTLDTAKRIQFSEYLTPEGMFTITFSVRAICMSGRFWRASEGKFTNSFLVRDIFMSGRFRRALTVALLRWATVFSWKNKHNKGKLKRTLKSKNADSSKISESNKIWH